MLFFPLPQQLNKVQLVANENQVEEQDLTKICLMGQVQP